MKIGGKIVKTFVLALFAVAFATVGGVMLCSCGPQGHEHVWGSWQSETQATCTEQGLQKRQCKICGQEEEEVVPVLPHTWINIQPLETEHFHKGECYFCHTVSELIPCTLQEQIFDATCDQAGYVLHTCTQCNSSHTHTNGQALGHLYADDDWTPMYQDENPDDDDLGTYLKKHIHFCKNDGTHFEQDECDFDLEHPEIVEATCETAGYTKFTCKVCGGFYTTDEQPATGHAYGQWQQSENLTDGHHEHFKECANENCPHKIVFEQCDLRLQQNTPATCDLPEINIFHCAQCERTTISEGQSALGHNFQIVGTSELVGDVYKHKKVCANNADHVIFEDCEFETQNIAATCLQQGYTLHTCKNCHGTYKSNFTEMLEHVWGSWREEDGWHVRTCSASVHEDERHQADYLEETTPENCETSAHTTLSCKQPGCDYTQVREGAAATGHVPSGVEHFLEGDTHRHKTYCTVCQKELSNDACIFEEEITNPTCDAQGYTTHTCSECGFEYTDSTQDATGHAWGEWQIDAEIGKHYRTCTNNNEHVEKHDATMIEHLVPANCTEDGEKYSTCSFEGCTISTEKEGLKALGHNWNKQEATFLNEEDKHQGHKDAKCSVCGATDTGAHQYTKNNFCDMCGWDGIVYTVKNGEAIVSNCRNVNAFAPQELIIPDTNPEGYNVVRVATAALRGCQAKKIFFGKNVVEIDYSAAYECTNLEEVVFHEGLKIIRPNAFERCAKLAKLSVLDKDDLVVKEAFVPSTITQISSSSFKNTAFEGYQQNWTDAKVGQNKVGKALYLGTQLLAVKLDEGKDSFEVLSGTKYIAEDVFRNLTALKAIKLPNSIVAIGRDAFFGCTNLQKVEFFGTVAQWLTISFANDFSSPAHFDSELTFSEVSSENLVILDGVTTIPAGCFRGDNLKSVVIAASVTSIGAHAFEDCTGLETIKIEQGSKLTYIGEDAFKNTKFWKTEQNWDENGALYLEIDSEDATKTYILVDVKENAQGQPAQFAKGEGFETRENTFTVKANTVMIASGAFLNCSALKHIVVDACVRYIGANAFVGCSGLQTLTFNVGEEKQDWMVWGEIIGRRIDVYENPTNNATNAKNVYVGKWYWI